MSAGEAQTARSVPEPGSDAVIRVRTVQREIQRAVGPNLMRELHRGSPLLDVAAMLATYAAFVGLAAALGILSIGPVWFAAFLAQGCVLQIMGLINHDLFVHRRFGGRRWSWPLSLLFTLPLTLDNNGYYDVHHRHHRFVGSEGDGEAYKQGLDTLAKRLIFCTALGVRRVKKLGYFRIENPTREVQRRMRLERRAKLAFAAGVAGLAWFWTWQVALGYLLPVVVMVPLLNSLRIIVEHADVDPENPFSLATFYRTGPISRVLTFWDSGDCHLIHHLFPNIPFYRIPRALNAIRPLLLERGIVERRSYLQLVAGWFVRTYPHRTLWPM